MSQLKNLDTLANELYLEGVEKAKRESAHLLADARQKSEEMILNAEKSAQEIMETAEEKAEKHRHAVNSEINQKGRQAKQDLMEQFKQLISFKLLDSGIEKSLSDADFVKELMLFALKHWLDGSDLEIKISKILMEKEPTLIKKVEKELSHVKVFPSDQIASGFSIEDHGKGYYLSFTDQAFQAFFEPYLSKEVGRILFQEE